MKRYLLLTLSIALPLLLFSSCSKFDKTPFWKVGDTVDDFVPAANYPATESFQSDLDALVTYALDIRAVRWGYYALVSKGGGKNKPFSSTLDDLDNNSACKTATQDLYRYIDGILERSDVYEEALSRLETSGVLKSPTTRGILSDAFDFIAGCKKAGIVSRKSLVTTMRELGWTSNNAKLKELYNSIPSEQRRGYTDYVEFWKDFSSGKLDNRASQIYANLYNYADPALGDKARDLGITPGKNITVVGAELIEKGAALVIDASPMSTQLGYGKDIFNSITATEKLITDGDVKGFLQNAAGNLVNYGRDAAKLADKLRGLDINYWDYGDQFWDLIGKDIATIWYNDFCFTEEYKNIIDKGEGERLIPNLVKTKDLNGQEITLVVMVDEGTGHVSIGYVLDKDGNVITNPQIPGQKVITVVNSTTGKRVTKTVNVNPKGDTEVDVDLEFDEKQLEEEPKNGELKLDPKSIDDKTGEGGNFYTKIDTNYMYYTCKSEDSWIECYIPTDVNIVYIKLTQNLTGKERTGKITVAATNSQGKVLKTTVMAVTQKPFAASEYAIKATPDGLEFDKNEGSQVVYVTLPGSVRSWGVEPDNKLVGWATVTPFMESDIYPAITVSVSENKTGKDRSSSFYIWASYDEKGNKIDYKTTVIVKQSAEASGKLSVKAAGISWNVMIYDDREGPGKARELASNIGVTTSELTGIKNTEIVVKEISNGYSVFLEQYLPKEGKPFDEHRKISFNLQYVNGKFGKITDIKCSNEFPGVLNNDPTYKESIAIKEMVFVKSDYVTNFIHTGYYADIAVWEAKEADKSLDWSFSRSYTSGYSDGKTWNYIYVPAPDVNKVELKIYYRFE